MAWGIYGATGVTGRLVVAEAVARGLRPVLLGRSEATLRPFAEQCGLDWRVAQADVIGSSALDSAVADLVVVLNAAGPFSITVSAVLESCLRGGTSYLDLSNELDTVTHTYAMHSRALAAGVTVVPGVGFGTVASDAVLRRVSDALPGADVLQVALLAGNAPGGPATRDSVLAVLTSGAAWYRLGKVRRARLGTGVQSISTPRGRRSVVPIGTGDLAAAARSLATGASTNEGHLTGSASVISASVALAVPALVLRWVLPPLGAVLRTGIPQWLLKRAERVKLPTRGVGSLAFMTTLRARSRSTPPRPRTYSSHAWARATERGGRSVTAWLDTGEGYAFSAHAAVSAVESVLAGTASGAFTPSQAFGADFALRVPGTHLVMLNEKGEPDATAQS